MDLNSDFAHFDEARPDSEINSLDNQCLQIESDRLDVDCKRLAAVRKSLIQSPSLSMGRFAPSDLLEILPFPYDPAVEILFRDLYRKLRQDRTPVTPRACLDLASGRIGSFGVSRDLVPSGLFSAVPFDSERNRAILMLRSVLTRVLEGGIWASTSEDAMEVIQSLDSPPFIQFDLGAMGFSERAVFTECVLKCLWKRNVSSKRETFIVIDEAHNVAPASPEHPWQRRTLEWVNRISGEGRKYGLYLMIVSQRPAKVHPNTLDNCRNYFLLRLQNQDDLGYLSKSTVEVSRSLLSRVSSFRRGEALIFGEIGGPAMIRIGRRRLK